MQYRAFTLIKVFVIVTHAYMIFDTLMNKFMIYKYVIIGVKKIIKTFTYNGLLLVIKKPWMSHCCTLWFHNSSKSTYI